MVKAQLVNRRQGDSLKPWPDKATARLFLRGLLQTPPDSIVGVEPDLAIWLEDHAPAVAEWLITQGLGPLAFTSYGRFFPGLKSRLMGDMASAAAESAVYAETMAEMSREFRKEQMPLVLLKGAALAGFAYAEPPLRTMSDVDIWVPSGKMPQTVNLMNRLGYQAAAKETRPVALQLLGGGEIQFQHPGKPYCMVELHWGPLDGWWLQRTAAIDVGGVWQRLVPLPADNQFCLGAEDMILQLAVHLAVNHRFTRTPVRALFDVALTAQTWPVDWQVVSSRAQAWRVATAVWAVLDLGQQLLGIPGVEVALKRLRPSPLRRRLLALIVSPEAILRGVDLRRSRMRYLLQLLLVDRPRDMVRLLFRTLWPEKEWLTARYQGRPNRWRHLWAVLRHGRI